MTCKNDMTMSCTESRILQAMQAHDRISWSHTLLSILLHKYEGGREGLKVPKMIFLHYFSALFHKDYSSLITIHIQFYKFKSLISTMIFN